MYNMGALYEDVEKFFGDLFALYSKLICWVPWMFIILPFLSCGLLGIGLLKMGHESKLDTLYTPQDSQAVKDRDLLNRFFLDNSGSNFYAHQSLGDDLYGEVILKALRPNGNLLAKSNMPEIFRLYEEITNVTIQAVNGMFSYETLCARRNGSCVIGGGRFIEYVRNSSCLPVEDMDVLDMAYLNSFIISNDILNSNRTFIRRKNKNCISAYAMRWRFHLRTDGEPMEALAKRWEIAFMNILQNFKSNKFEISYCSALSLEIELRSHVGEDVKYFPISVAIMVVYATIVSSGGNCVSTKGHVSRAGIVGTLLAMLAAFGVLGMADVDIVDTCGVMPYLILGIGMDNVFKLMSNYGRTDVKACVVKRVSGALRRSAISILITSLTTLFCVCIGATSPFVSVKNFCIYCGVALAFCYINQLTFFSGCLVLHARRVKASRHCITCIPTRSREDLKNDGKPFWYIWLCGGEPPRKARDEDGPWERIPSDAIPKILLSFPCKTVVMLLFGLYISLSAWGASQMRTGLKLETLVPSTSNLYTYFKDEEIYFSRGPVVSFVVPKPVQYSNQQVRNEVYAALEKARLSNYADPDLQISWLDSYEQFLLKTNRTDVFSTEESFLKILQTEFLPEYSEFQNDIVFNADKRVILASRFYVQGYKYDSAQNEGDLMTTLREVAKNSTLPLIAYCPEFIYYEHYVTILKNTLLGVGVAMIGMLFVALMFIPHPIAVTCVVASMVTIVLGMFGFMHFWGLALSALTKVQIILSVGFCVEFTVQITHAFMTATGKNRNERVGTALIKVGIPTLNSALSTILSTVILAFGKSYVFTAFFKSTIILVVLSLLHALVFLPVILSFVGPRRTSRPRVFIPVSPSSRSLQFGAPIPSCIVRRQDSEKQTSHCDDERQPLNPLSENSTAHSDKTEDCPISPSTKTSDIMTDSEISEGVDSSGNTPEELMRGSGSLPANHCIV